MDISFKLDPEVVIGADTLSLAGTIAGRHGSRMMIAADSKINSQFVNRLKGILEDSGLDAIVFDGIDTNSSAEMANNIVELANAGHCDAIIGFGGERALTIARMAAIMAPMRISAFELLDGRSFQTKFLPFIAIPTEGMSPFSITDFFITIDPRSRLVKSIPSPNNLCSALIIDSNLFSFISDNSDVNNTAAIVLENFLFAAEAYCSARSNFLSDAILERAISIYARLIKGGTSGLNAELFAQATFLSAFGSSASSPGVGAALSMAISARTPIAKPLCSAALFPSLSERLVNARPEKMARLGAFFGAGKAATVAEGAALTVTVIRRIMETLNIQPNLKEFNISLDRITASAEAARSLDFIMHSPWTVSEEEVFKILKDIF